MTPTVEDLRPDGVAKQHVVVIGAGMAGLSAAYQLRAGGHRVDVLEARLRPGGRVHTVRGFADDLHAEAGALFIATDHPYLMKYVDLAGVELDPIHARELSNFYYFRGQRILTESEPITWPFDLTAEERELGLDGMKTRYMGRIGDTLGDITDPDWPPPELEPYDHLTMQELLKQEGASDEARELLRLAYHARWGDGGRTTSALFMLRNYLDLLESESATVWKTVRGGNDLVPRAIARSLGELLHYGAAVRRIETADDGVTVHFGQAGQRRSITADRVVCALPFACLRDIEIDPPLSPQKRAAVEQIRSTSVTRVFLQVRARFWSQLSELGTMGATDLPIGLVRDATFNQPGTRGILEAYCGGDDATNLAALPESERIERVLEHMERVMPGTQEHLEGGLSIAWDNEEYSRGDYAWFSPGQLTTLGKIAGTAEGRVHFAGDQTSPWTGWQQGAIHSGHRVAREIHEAPA